MRRFAIALTVTASVAAVAAPATSARHTTPAPHVSQVIWMNGSASPGTPARYDKVGVIKITPGSGVAKNVIVFEPGTSAAAAYFVPLAEWLVQTVPGWQVWAIQRRESLLEDQSELRLAKQHKVSGTQLFDYYLGFIGNSKITDHMPSSYLTLAPAYAKQWGLNVAVNDVRIVLDAAKKLGGKVVLGGHSLGGGVVTAYATWDFGGKPGADGLAGLVYDDGGSGPPESAANAQAALTGTTGGLDLKATSPWLNFGGIAAPFAGLFNDTGALGVLEDPNAPSLGQTFPLLPADLKPPVPVTNEAQYGYALNYKTSPKPGLLAAQGHLGTGISSHTINGYHTWNGAGALTPITRFATMFGAPEELNAAGTEWYFPQRLTDDMGAVGNGIANPAQKVLDVHSTMGRKLPHSLYMLAFGTVLGNSKVPAAARALAKQSGIPSSHVTTFDYQNTYSHNDPAGAYPKNAFFTALVKFLKRISP
jgi:pimeloyl-ACP methyl ester carboxylesterase